VKYAWIARHKALWPITLSCQVLGVSASGYFEHWRRKDADKPSRPGANRRISDEALLVHIKAIHAARDDLAIDQHDVASLRLGRLNRGRPPHKVDRPEPARCRASCIR
jgi:hypothetical protein